MPIPQDDKLQRILRDGGFETLLRSPVGPVSGAGLTGRILNKWKGIGAAAAEWLAEKAMAAFTSAQQLSVLREGQRLNIADIPRVPSGGIEGTEPGTIVILGQDVIRDPDSGEPTYVHWSSIVIAPPTPEDLIDIRNQIVEAARRKYDLGEITGEILSDVVSRTYGIYQIE